MNLNNLQGNTEWYKIVFPLSSSETTPDLHLKLRAISNPFNLDATVSDIRKISRSVELHHAGGYRNLPLFRLAYSLALHSEHSILRKVQLIEAIPSYYIPTFPRIPQRASEMSFLDEHIVEYVLWLAEHAPITLADKAINYILARFSNLTPFIQKLTTLLHRNARITPEAWQALIALKSIKQEVGFFSLFIGLDKTGKHSWEVAKSLSQHATQQSNFQMTADRVQDYRKLENEAVRLARILLNEDLTQTPTLPDAWYFNMIATFASK